MTPKSDPRWREAISGERAVQFESLPLRIILSRARLDLERNPGSSDILQRYVDELYAFCAKFPDLVGDDIKKLFA